MKKNRYENREAIADSLKLSKDVVLGASIVTVTGNSEALIENYKGIIEYTEQKIILQGKTCKIIFVGRNLRIVYYTNEDMKICGCIEHILYG